MSTDCALGLPFNIAFYSLLTLMVAQVTGMVADELVWTGGDTHLYANQIEPMREMLKRKPLSPPRVKLNPDVTDIFAFKAKDFQLLGYMSHPAIKMDVAK